MPDKRPTKQCLGCGKRGLVSNDYCRTCRQRAGAAERGASSKPSRIKAPVPPGDPPAES